ncbi:MAG: AI-2E family transporter [Magnetococcus sp. DMHC-6]
MTDSNYPLPHPYQEGFLIGLLVLALIGLIWLFSPFLPGLFFAILLTSSTYPFYRKRILSLPLSSDSAAFCMTVLMLSLVVVPLLYLLIATGMRATHLVMIFRGWLAGFENVAQMAVALRVYLLHLPLSMELREFLLAQLIAHQGDLGQLAAAGVLFFFKGITNNGLAFLSSLLLIAFSLFFFYRDGPTLVERVKILTPLGNHLDDFLLNRFALLASVLTMSTLSIALLQGVSLALVTFWMGLPWFYLGVAMAVASFIPVVGGMLVWGPVTYWLFQTGETGAAVFLMVWGIVVIGFVADNLLRPLLIARLTQLQQTKRSGQREISVLHYTLLTTLSTFGGVMAFGFFGLFFGPIMAAMAITVFELFEITHGHLLDRS